MKTLLEGEYTDTKEFVLALAALTRIEGSQTKLAKNLGVSPQYLHDVLSFRREPGKKILGAMGFERVVLYRKVNEV